MTLPVAAHWYSVTEVEPGILAITEPHVVRLFRANFFLVRGRDADLLVDTGMGIGDLPALLARLRPDGKPLAVVTTHTHIDHIGGHPAVVADAILVHPAEEAALCSPPMPAGLAYDMFTQHDRAGFRAAGFDTDSVLTGGLLIDALPHAGFEPRGHRFPGVVPAGTVEDGAVIDLGDRRFQILHRPGHSPGSLVLWDAASATLIGGDVIYDGVLVDTLDGADISAYLRSMEQLRELPVRTVHGGHRASFGRDRMIEIIDSYIATRTGAAARPDRPAISF